MARTDKTWSAAVQPPSDSKYKKDDRRRDDSEFDEDNDCAICYHEVGKPRVEPAKTGAAGAEAAGLKEAADVEEWAWLPCGHAFGNVCIEKWLYSQQGPRGIGGGASCPLCNRSMVHRKCGHIVFPLREKCPNYFMLPVPPKGAAHGRAVEEKSGGAAVQVSPVPPNAPAAVGNGQPTAHTTATAPISFNQIPRPEGPRGSRIFLFHTFQKHLEKAPENKTAAITGCRLLQENRQLPRRNPLLSRCQYCRSDLADLIRARALAEYKATVDKSKTLQKSGCLLHAVARVSSSGGRSESAIAAALPDGPHPLAPTGPNGRFVQAADLDEVNMSPDEALAVQLQMMEEMGLIDEEGWEDDEDEDAGEIEAVPAALADPAAAVAGEEHDAGHPDQPADEGGAAAGEAGQEYEPVAGEGLDDEEEDEAATASGSAGSSGMADVGGDDDYGLAVDRVVVTAEPSAAYLRMQHARERLRHRQMHHQHHHHHHHHDAGAQSALTRYHESIAIGWDAWYRASDEVRAEKMTSLREKKLRKAAEKFDGAKGGRSWRNLFLGPVVVIKPSDSRTFEGQVWRRW